MIKRISINFPSINVNLDREFSNWINIIEEKNWYWKSVLIQTILSLFTNKYNNKALPSWVVSIETSAKTYILNKQTWIGRDIVDNNLYQYCLPWNFFKLLETTWEQRWVMVKLLWLDYNEFLANEIYKLWDDYKLLTIINDESVLKAQLKKNLASEETILEDIVRLQSDVIQFEDKDFSDVERYKSDLATMKSEVDKYNQDALLSNTKVTYFKKDITKLENDIIKYEELISSIKITIADLEYELKNNICKNCWSTYIIHKDKDLVITKINNLNKDIVNYSYLIEKSNKEIKNLESKIIEPIIPLDIKYITTCWLALGYNSIPVIAPEREKEYLEHQSTLSKISFIKDELSRKQKQLIDLDTLCIRRNLDKLIEIKKRFTEHLDNSIKSIWLDISLFKVNKDWTIKESFIVQKDWIEYSKLSNWNKLLLDIKIAKLFIDKLNFPYLLVDEWALISKDNIQLIKDIWLQTIICKPTPYTVDDFK